MNALEQTLGDLARVVPGATAIFHRHHLDFCCGGRQTLAQAAQEKGVDADAILRELNHLPSPTEAESRWSEASDIELIEHILTRYHDVHRQQFPELIRLSQRVELVHGGHPACPAGLSDHLEVMATELEAHMQKEERVLFPMISRGMRDVAAGPVAMMRHEHDDHGAALARIGDLTAGITLPPGACNTWRALYTGLEALQQDLMDHIHLENNILFERIDGRGETDNG